LPARTVAGAWNATLSAVLPSVWCARQNARCCSCAASNRQGGLSILSALARMVRMVRIASLAKRWLLGTHQGAVDSAHWPSDLNEFVFRFNRRRSRRCGRLFYRILELAVTHGPVRYQDLVMNQSPKPVPPRPPNRRGHPPSLERSSPGRPWRKIANSGYPVVGSTQDGADRHDHDFRQHVLYRQPLSCIWPPRKGFGECHNSSSIKLGSRHCFVGVYKSMS